jgi:dienelactone hydrolase
MDYMLNGELVSFETQDKLTLHGFLARPKGKSSKAIIAIHGLFGDFYGSNRNRLIAKKAVANGINFLTIELRGSYAKNSLQKRTGKKSKWVASGCITEKFENCIYDIDGAIRFLQKLGVKKIVLMGHSTGCQKITYYQFKRKNRKVKALILLAPADDYNTTKKDLGRRFNRAVGIAHKLCKKDRSIEMPKEFHMQYSAGRFLSFSDTKFAEARIFDYESRKLKEFSAIKEPILAVFGSKEQYALKPVKEYMKTLERDTSSRQFDYLIVRGADHSFTRKEKEISNKLITWLKSLSQF